MLKKCCEVAALVLVSLFTACKSIKTVDEQLAATRIKDPKRSVKIYQSGTKPIEQVKDPSKLNFDIWKIDANLYPKQITLFARVIDSSGNFVTNLAPPVRGDQDFWKLLRERIGKRRVDINNFTVREFGDGDSIPYAINLLVDYSGSMNGVIDAIYEGTELFISLKQKQDEISISTFNKSYDCKVPFASDGGYLLSKYRSARERGFGSYSAFNDALLRSIKMFDSLPASMPRILVAFSDGDDNYSTAKSSEIFKAAQERDVHIFTVAFGYAHDEVLDYIATNTGGKFYQVYSKAELVSVFQEIYRSLRNYYLVSYTPPEAAVKHYVTLGLQTAGIDTLFANGEYDRSDITMFTEEFNKRILFDYNQSTLRAESSPIIEELVEQLNRQERVWLEVQGHTDNIGGEEFNQRLSEARAQAVVNALIQRGIESHRLKPRGMGMLYPVVANDTDEHRAQNRRTVFVVLRR